MQPSTHATQYFLTEPNHSKLYSIIRVYNDSNILGLVRLRRSEPRRKRKFQPESGKSLGYLTWRRSLRP